VEGSFISLLYSLLSELVVQDMNCKVVYYYYRFHAHRARYELKGCILSL
jgi:hypothetical protein